MREAATREALPEAVAVSRAFAALDGDDTLSESDPMDAIRPALSGRWSASGAANGLLVPGLVRGPSAFSWEQGIPLPCAHFAERAVTD